MSEESTEQLKVVDKRRFAGSAQLTQAERTEPEQREEKPEAARSQVGTEQEQSEVDFPSFVVSMATQAMVMLGQIPNPETQQSAQNLPAARQTIDILGMLEVKTKGNLNEEEERLLGDVLASLRVAYVQISKE